MVTFNSYQNQFSESVLSKVDEGPRLQDLICKQENYLKTTNPCKFIENTLEKYLSLKNI